MNKIYRFMNKFLGGYIFTEKIEFLEYQKYKLKVTVLIFSIMIISIVISSFIFLNDILPLIFIPVGGFIITWVDTIYKMRTPNSFLYTTEEVNEMKMKGEIS